MSDIIEDEISTSLEFESKYDFVDSGKEHVAWHTTLSQMTLWLLDIFHDKLKLINS